MGRAAAARARAHPRRLPPDVLDLEDDDEAARPQALPSLGSSMRTAASDVYFNSWRLAPANLVWGAIAVLAIVAGPGSLIGLTLLVILSIPTAGLHRMGALIARGEPAAFSDFLDGMRRLAGQALFVGAAALAATLVLTTNILVGLESGNPVGWFVSALALWGAIGLAMALAAFWPILCDPRRDGLGLRRRLALAGVVVLGRPRRMIALTLVLTVILVVSTILFAALVIVSVAYVSVLASRYVLPTVDEVESRLIA
jgi:hypothetical protein